MARLSYAVTIIGIALMCVLAEELYSDRYDDVDVTNIIGNDTLRVQYYKCFMEASPCVTADAKFFKEIFGEAIQTQCKKCTEKQKEKMRIFVNWYKKNKPDEWEALAAKSIENLKKKNAGQ